MPSRLDLKTVTHVTTHSPGNFTLHTPFGDLPAQLVETIYDKTTKARLQVTFPSQRPNGCGQTFAHRLEPKASGDELRARFDLKMF